MTWSNFVSYVPLPHLPLEARDTLEMEGIAEGALVENHSETNRIDSCGRLEVLCEERMDENRTTEEENAVLGGEHGGRQDSRALSAHLGSPAEGSEGLFLFEFRIGGRMCLEGRALDREGIGGAASWTHAAQELRRSR
ncbi:hypothetical protein NDU88_012253 [Pleurodeles waltl]|uniref:Uncharacterized protein n=1 Tax=Pleurodeles waltl TaxID=8319 RepID=A0AAV7R5N4_PLEWA|nr:hypothetical protein NDU88_012253 [Pleurodeles waltl]